MNGWRSSGRCASNTCVEAKVSSPEGVQVCDSKERQAAERGGLGYTVLSFTGLEWGNFCDAAKTSENLEFTVTEPGRTVVMRKLGEVGMGTLGDYNYVLADSAAPNAALFFDEAEVEAFVQGVKDGEFVPQHTDQVGSLATV